MHHLQVDQTGKLILTVALSPADCFVIGALAITLGAIFALCLKRIAGDDHKIIQAARAEGQLIGFNDAKRAIETTNPPAPLGRMGEWFMYGVVA